MSDAPGKQVTLNDGRNLGFLEYGDSKGYPIIYCHGSQSSRLERHYDASFAEKNGLRIISVDRPGHGYSDHRKGRSISDFAHDVVELTTFLNIEKFSVAGMSAGAPFALAIASNYPERVTAVGLISGFAPYHIEEVRTYLSKEVGQMLKLAKSFPFLLRMLLKLQAGMLKNKPQKTLENFLKIMSEPDQEILRNESVKNIIIEMFVEAFRKGCRGVAYEISHLMVREWGFELRSIKIPVKIWQGEKDKNVPKEWAVYLANSLPNSELTLIPHEGHLLIFNYAEQIFTGLKP